MSNIHNLQADLDLKDNVLISVACKQLDDLELELDIWNNGQEIDLSNYSCRLTAIKIDGVPFIQDTAYTIVKNKVKIQCERQLTATQGITKADLIFIDKATKKQKHSFDLDIIVKPSVLSRGGEISKPTLTLLEQIDEKLDEIENIGQVLDEAKKTRDDLIVKTNTANESEKNLIQTTTTADNKKKEVEGTISNASKKITEVNTSIDNANNTKKSLISTATEKVQELKETADIEKQAIINTADTKKEEINKIIANADTKKGELENTLTVATTKKEQLDSVNVQAQKNIDVLNSFGDATDLTKKVNTLENKVLKNESTPIKTDSTLTKLSDCAGGYVRNMQIKGRTLQNLVTGVVKTTEQFRNFCFSDLLKPNTTYTLIINNTSDTNYNCYFNEENFTTGGNLALPKGISIKKTTTKNTIVNNTLLKNFTGGNQSFTLDSIMLLEGEPKEIPPYFEGIKSTGELEGNKISILSCSKNLFSFDKFNPNNATYEIINSHELKMSVSNAFNGVWKRVDHLIIGNKYTFSLNAKSSKNCKLFFGAEKINTPTVDITNEYKQLSVTFTAVAKTQTFFIYNQTELENIIYIKDIILTNGITTEDFEDYKSDKTEILLPSPHMGLPNGVSDVVDYDKNERTKNVKTFVLDPTWGWNRTAVDIDTPNTIEFQCGYPNIKGNSLLICDKFNYIEVNHLWSHDIEGITVNPTKNIQIRISKSKLETPDANGFKKWLQANPTTIYYQLANPITEKLTIKDTLQAFENGYIQLDNAITPTTQLEYSTNIPSAIGGLTKVVDHNVDEITNIESTISDLDAEIGEARKDKNTLNERLEDDRTNILNKFNNYAKKDGTLQTGLNAEMLTGITQDKLMKSYDLNSVNIDNKYLENYIVNISEDDLTKYGTKPSSSSWISVTNTWGGHFIRQTASTCNNTIDNPRMWVRTRYIDSKSMWSEWRELATTETKELTLLNGWKVAWEGLVPSVARAGNIVTVNAVVGGGLTNANTVICKLPAPRYTQPVVLGAWQTGKNANHLLRVDTNGDLSIDTIDSTAYSVALTFSYVI
ncbi:hypothetical protein FC789_12950 [Clostridium botulinum]|nr:hypothetical protein [Clostridium botulinum]